MAYKLVVNGKWICTWTFITVDFFQHIGLYAFRPKALRDFASMAMGDLEKAESLEQLRWLEGGHEIYCGMVQEVSVSVDTPEDAEAVRAMMGGALPCSFKERAVV